MGNKCVLGVDFGTDSVRCIVVDTSSGDILSESVSYYQRWKDGLYIDEKRSIFRQHPLDYIESFESCVKDAVASSNRASDIVSISIDTTGSTPAIVDRCGMPLALREEFSEDPDAMFFLWKDHSAINEALKINTLAHSGKFEDYTKYSGGTYSSEWFWSKVLYAITHNENVRREAYSAVEHCDWIPALLTGKENPNIIKRGRCSSGHKCMWNEKCNGYPDRAFFSALDPKLAEIRDTLSETTYTLDNSAGIMTKAWSERLGLNSDVVVGIGAIDAHMGAIGGGIKQRVMVKSIGTSTCDIVIAEVQSDKGFIKGICGEVNGSVLPDFIGYEAGQSAWGDYFSWFRSLCLWGIDRYTSLDIKEKVLEDLEKDAMVVPLTFDSPVALDWINGRRTPNANQYLKASWEGLDFSVTTPALFKMLLESVSYGARMIIDCFEDNNVIIDKIVVVGGVARKSSLGMQILADVTGREIEVSSVSQCGAYGAAIVASVLADVYPTIEVAIEKLNKPVLKIYKPDNAKHEIYNKLYEKYKKLGSFIENNSPKM